MNNDVTQTKSDFFTHGGDPAGAEARFGMPKNGWLDLSTGINAVPYALPVMPLEILHRLPLAQDMDGLLLAAQEVYGVADKNLIVASPGTQALIQLIPTIFESSAVEIVSPTYGEHVTAWRKAGHKVNEVSQITNSARYALVVNPNNPDGNVYTPQNLLALADQLYSRGGALIVDEAFADVVPELSVTFQAEHPGLIVLRSFGKFYGLAGVRLGFAICAPALAKKIASKLGPWAVSGPAIWAGTEALNDQIWRKSTRNRLKIDASRMDDVLFNAGFEIVGGTDLFRLGQSAKAWEIFEKLGNAGILTRPFSYRGNWLRFGLPGCEGDWQRLSAALEL